MKWYIASRMRHKRIINSFLDFLKLNNQSIAFEWSKLGSLKPYSKNQESSAQIAQEISNALKETNIFVLITDSAGTDMFIELGIAISMWDANQNLKIYTVGEHNQRSLMHFHPAIKRVKTLKELLLIECPEIVNEKNTKTIEGIDLEIRKEPEPHFQQNI